MAIFYWKTNSNAEQKNFNWNINFIRFNFLLFPLFFYIVQSFIYWELVENQLFLFFSSDSLQSVFGVSSIIISIIIPVIIGPILSLVVLLILSAVFLVTGVKSCKESQLEDRRNICCNMLLTIIFIPTYTTSMIISELYFPIPDNIFHFILLKFIIGVSHQLLGPMAILLSQTDIRNNVVQVYRKGGTSQNTTMEMTYEELQRNLGLGVDIG